LSRATAALAALPGTQFRWPCDAGLVADYRLNIGPAKGAPGLPSATQTPAEGRGPAEAGVEMPTAVRMAVVETPGTASNGHEAAQPLALLPPSSVQQTVQQQEEVEPLLHRESQPLSSFQTQQCSSRSWSSRSMKVSCSSRSCWSWARCCGCCARPGSSGASWLAVLGVGSIAGTLSGVMGGLTGEAAVWSLLCSSIPCHFGGGGGGG
jgi:hypothetical protein